MEGRDLSLDLERARIQELAIQQREAVVRMEQRTLAMGLARGLYLERRRNENVDLAEIAGQAAGIAAGLHSRLLEAFPL